MRRMRVLHVIPRFVPFGAEHMVAHLLRNHHRAAVECEAVSLYPRQGTELEAALGRAGATVTFLGKRVGPDPRVFYWLDGIFRRFRPDVVHSHLYILSYVYPPALLRRVPLLAHTVHNEPDRELQGFGGVGEVSHRLAYRLGVVPVALSDDMAGKLRTMYGLPSTPTVIPNGIPVADYERPRIPRAEWRARQGFGAKDFLFVAVGRLTEQKNHKLLVEAFARRLAGRPGARLLFAGDGELRSELERQVDAAGLGEKVRFLGLRDDVPELLGAIDVFVVSSAWEGHPLSVMEAMAAGRPIAATAVGGLPELISEGVEGLLTTPGDPDALGAAMLRLMAEPALCAALGAAANRRAREKLGVEAMTRAYEALYRRELARRGRDRDLVRP